MEDEILEFTYKRAQKKSECTKDQWLEVSSTEVKARDRKLKATWSYEAAQDLRTWHNIDSSQTLADKMLEEMLSEMDREILNDLCGSK